MGTSRGSRLAYRVSGGVIAMIAAASLFAACTVGAPPSADPTLPAPPATLEVTEAELNALILRDPELAKSVRARLGPGKVFFDVSYPMSRLPAPASTLLGDRWFNGTVECNLKIEDGRIAVDPIGAVTAKDQERVDDWRLQPLRESRFLDQLGGERLEQIAGKAASVDVREGRIVIKK